MIRSSIALAVVAALAGSGCVLRGDGRGVAYAVDTGMIVGGGAMVADGKEECHSFEIDCELGNDLQDLAGGLLIAGGIVGLVITMAVNATKPPPAPEAAVAASYARPSDLVPSPADDCTPHVRDWLRERDPKRKTERYEALPETCRAQITSPETHANSAAASPPRASKR